MGGQARGGWAPGACAAHPPSLRDSTTIFTRRAPAPYQRTNCIPGCQHPPAAPTCSTLSSALNCSVAFFCAQAQNDGTTHKQSSAVKGVSGPGGGGRPRAGCEPQRHAGQCHFVPPLPPRWPAALLACVSWNERMTTTGCRFWVRNRSLICALTSVSPATCREWWGAGMGCAGVGGCRSARCRSPPSCDRCCHKLPARLQPPPATICSPRPARPVRARPPHQPQPPSSTRLGGPQSCALLEHPP